MGEKSSGKCKTYYYWFRPQTHKVYQKTLCTPYDNVWVFKGSTPHSAQKRKGLVWFFSQIFILKQILASYVSGCSTTPVILKRSIYYLQTAFQSWMVWVILFVCIKNECPSTRYGRKIQILPMVSHLLFFMNTWLVPYSLPVSPLLSSLANTQRCHRAQTMADKGCQSPSFYDSKRMCNDFTPCHSFPTTYYCHWFLRDFRRWSPVNKQWFSSSSSG